MLHLEHFVTIILELLLATITPTLPVSTICLTHLIVDIDRTNRCDKTEHQEERTKRTIVPFQKETKRRKKRSICRIRRFSNKAGALVTIDNGWRRWLVATLATACGRLLCKILSFACVLFFWSKALATYHRLVVGRGVQPFMLLPPIDCLLPMEGIFLLLC